MANSTARRLSAGSAPGIPRQTGQQLLFRSLPKALEQPQKTFVFVFSSAWISRPITGI
jgi:hypothetical protein